MYESTSKRRRYSILWATVLLGVSLFAASLAGQEQPPAVIPLVSVGNSPSAASSDSSDPPQVPWYWDDTQVQHAAGGMIVDDSQSIATCSCNMNAHHDSVCTDCGVGYQSWFDHPLLQSGGWIQQGATLNPDSPSNRSNAPVLFNDRANDYQLNQLYLFLGKQVRADGYHWDIGGRFDILYGTDARFVTVPGLEEHKDRTPKWNSETDDYGLAVPQAYVDVATPLGAFGSTLRLGHFYSFGGYETFTAPDNFFYSHAYTYLYGEPFTQSGAMWFGNFGPSTAGAVAVTTGWDSLLSDGDEWGLRGSLMRKMNGGRTSLTFNASVGNDFTGISDTNGSRDATRAWASIVMKHTLSRQMHYVLQTDFGHQDDAVVVLDGASSTVDFDSAQWYSLNQYLIYQLNQAWSAGMRAEWFRDQGNSRVGVPIEYANGGPVFNGNDYFELTGGVNWRPHSNVTLRNEVRWDASTVRSNPAIPGGIAGIRPFNDRSDKDQITIGFDLIVLF